MIPRASLLRSAVPCLLALASTVTAVWAPALRVPTYEIGGSGGTDFTLLARAGRMVKLVRFYRSHGEDEGQFLRGVYVEYTDGTKEHAGAEKGESQEIHLEDNEVIKSMTLWGNGIGTRAGRISFETSKQKFEFGKDDVSKQDSYPMDVGSGYLIGFSGRAGDDIDCLSPIFLKPVKKLLVDNVNYPSFDASKGLSLRTLKQEDSKWDGHPWNMHFSGTEETTETTTWTFEFSTSFSPSVSVEAGILGIADVTTKFEWQIGEKRSQVLSTSSKTSLTWTVDTPINSPADAVRCTAEYWAGDAQIDWTGTMHLTLAEDPQKRYFFDTSGSMQRVSSSKVVATCKKLDESR